MRLSRFLLVWACVFLLPFLVSAQEYAPGQLIVRLKNPLPESQLRATGIGASLKDPVLQKYPVHEIRGTGAIGKLPSSGFRSFRHSAASRAYHTVVIELDSSVNLPEVLNDFRQNENVVWVEPNYIFRAFLVPQDTYYIPYQKSPVEMVKGNLAWDISFSSANITVAVIDTGIDLQHEDLVGNFWQNPAEIPVNGIDDDTNGFIDDIVGWDFVTAPPPIVGPGEDGAPRDNNPDDVQGHGTHVSGIIAATINNNRGIAGMAPRSRLMALRAGYKDDEGNGLFFTSDIVDAIYYAVDNGAHVINMSFGGPATSNFLAEAIATANVAGVVLVAAAGNEASNLDLRPVYPGSYPGVITVSAINSSPPPTFTNFSNFGSVVDISAPGTTIASTTPNPPYGLQSGTSQSTPLVSAAAASLLSIAPTLTTQNIYDILTQTAVDAGPVGKDDRFGYGVLNIYDALLTLDSQFPTGSHTFSPTHDIGAPIIITMNATDDFNSYSIPSVNIWYRPVINGMPSGNFQAAHMTKLGLTQQASLPAGSTSMEIDYYFEIDDTSPTRTVFLPATAPAQFFTTAVDDLSPPQISFEPKKENDYFSPNEILNITITDNTTVASASIVFTIVNTNDSFTLSDSGLTYSAPVLTVDLSQLPVPQNESVTFRVAAADLSNHTASASITFQPGNELLLFGPEGPGSPVINYPNPFDPSAESTRVAYHLSRDATVTILIYSLYLNPIRKIERFDFAGYHEVIWDGRDDAGDEVPNGVYPVIIKAESDGKTVVKQLKVAALKR